MNSFKVATAALAVSVLMCVHSADARSTLDKSDWMYEIAPFYWSSEFEGRVTVNGRLLDVNTDLFDLSNNYGGSLHLEAWRDRFAVMLDAYGLKLYKGADSADERRGNATIYTTEFSGAYLFREFPVSLEILAGGRWQKAKSRVIDTSGTVERSRDWFDPMLGVRAGFEISDRFTGWLRADASGVLFGSELTWNVSAILAYQLHPFISLGLGYKIFDVDYETGSESDLFKYDVQSRGVIFGVIFYL